MGFAVFSPVAAILNDAVTISREGLSFFVVDRQIQKQIRKRSKKLYSLISAQTLKGGRRCLGKHFL